MLSWHFIIDLLLLLFCLYSGNNNWNKKKIVFHQFHFHCTRFDLLIFQANSNRSLRLYCLLHEGSPFSLPLQVCARLKLLTFVWASRRHEFSKNFAIRYFEMVTVGQILNPPQSRRDSFNIKLPLLPDPRTINIYPRSSFLVNRRVTNFTIRVNWNIELVQTLPKSWDNDNSENSKVIFFIITTNWNIFRERWK